MAKSDKKAIKVINQGDVFAGPYLLGFVGAAVYFVQQVDGFWPVIGAILKAIVWPAFLVHGLFDVLNV